MIDFTDSELKVLLAGLDLLKDTFAKDKIFLPEQIKKEPEERVKDLEVKLHLTKEPYKDTKTVALDFTEQDLKDILVGLETLSESIKDSKIFKKKDKIRIASLSTRIQRWYIVFRLDH